MRQAKKIFLPFLLLCCLIIGSINVTADELTGTVIDGSALTENSEAESIVYPYQRGSYLSNGTGKITIAGTGKVTITGSTSAYQTVDQIKVTLYLQRLEGSSWVTIATLGPKTSYNTNYVSNSKTYSVTRGYYYRVTGGHTVIEGSKTESLVSSTDGVKVS